MNVYEKLAAVQTELKAPKSQRNTFGDFNYRSCEDILEALKPLLHKAGALVTISDEIVNIAGRFYVKATARFHDLEAEGTVEVTAYAREPESRVKMDDAQTTGSSSSDIVNITLHIFCTESLSHLLQ